MNRLRWGSACVGCCRAAGAQGRSWRGSCRLCGSSGAFAWLCFVLRVIPVCQGSWVEAGAPAEQWDALHSRAGGLGTVGTVPPPPEGQLAGAVVQRFREVRFFAYFTLSQRQAHASSGCPLLMLIVISSYSASVELACSGELMGEMAFWPRPTLLWHPAGWVSSPGELPRAAGVGVGLSRRRPAGWGMTP